MNYWLYLRCVCSFPLGLVYAGPSPYGMGLLFRVNPKSQPLGVNSCPGVPFHCLKYTTSLTYYDSASFLTNLRSGTRWTAPPRNGPSLQASSPTPWSQSTSRRRPRTPSCSCKLYILIHICMCINIYIYVYIYIHINLYNHRRHDLGAPPRAGRGHRRAHVSF